MRHLRWQALIAILGLVLAVGLLAGQSVTRVIVDEPVVGSGKYTEALIGAPRALNPLLTAFNPVDRDLSQLLFTGLTRFDALGRPEPDLANWFISADQRTYTFLLKPGVTWHDGAPVTAADVAFTIDLLKDPATPGAADLKQLWQTVAVVVTGTQTVAVTLPEPFAPFLDYTSFGLLPEHLLGTVTPGALAQSPFNLSPVGTGPFVFDRWLAENGQVTGLLLRAAPAFYDVARQPALAELEFRFFPDAAAALAAYEQGVVLGLSRVRGAELAAAAELPTLRLYSTLEPEYTLIFLNLRDETLPFFKERRVRQALLLGLNRSQMVNTILRGQGVVANSPVLPGSWAYNLNLTTVGYDPVEAAALLAGAGWGLPQGVAPGSPDYVRQKNNVPLRFTLTTPDDEVHLALAAAAQVTWAAIGVQVEVVPVPAATLRSAVLEPRAFQAVMVDFSLAGTPDPDPYPLWHETQAESGQNYGGWTDRAVSQYLEQARITTDTATRARLYQNFQARFADQTPALLLYYPVYTYAVDAKVNGVRLGPLTEASDRFASLPGWYTETRRTVVEQPGN